MCIYCKNLTTPTEYTPIIENSLDFGIAGGASNDVFIDKNKEDIPSLILNFLPNDENEIRVAAPIHYCPICGEKLTKD